MPKLVGGEVDGYCTKCKMVLAHTILAMVGERIARVRCNTCMGEHAYKAGPPGEPKPRSTTARAPGSGVRRGAASFDEQMAAKDSASAKPYSVNEKFAADQVIDHPTFGRGFVSAARADKIDVTFKSFVKTLVHARGGKAAPARPVIPPRPHTEPEVAAAGPDEVHDTVPDMNAADLGDEPATNEPHGA